MMELLLILLFALLVPLMRWLDKERGHAKENETISKIVALIGLGLCSSVLLVDWSLPWQTLLAQTAIITAAVSMAYNMPGFGEPIGHAITGRTDKIYESWQYGPLRKNPWLALSFYGAVFFPLALLILSLLASLFLPINWAWVPAMKLAIAHGIAWPGACAIVRHIRKMPTRTTEQAGSAWGMQEKDRGTISGLVLLTFAVITMVNK